MSLMGYTREERQGICEFIKEIMKTSHKCQHCQMSEHTINGMCLFAYKCMTNDFSEYTEGD